jgi:hypothetical protein
LAEFSAISSKTAKPFQIHSLEPPPPLYAMRQHFLQNISKDEVRSVWTLSQIRSAKSIFKYFWHEGSWIDRNQNQEPNTKVVTLDWLAYGPDNVFGNCTLDVVKIDAEEVDALVLNGAA